MENPRAEKVAVVDEVRAKLEGADAVLLTEYRGLKVSELATLRRSMRDAGGEYRVYKNTLVRRAARELDLELDDKLTGPTALAFVSAKADGSPGDIATVAKAVQDFSKSNPLLVLKGGVLGDRVLDADSAKALASLPTASEVYSRLAGAINSGARGMASVISGVHRSLALVINAAAEAGAFAGDAPAPAAEAPAEAPVEAEAPAEAPAEADPEPAAESTDAAATDTTAAEATEPEADSEAPAAADTPEEEN